MGKAVCSPLSDDAVSILPATLSQACNTATASTSERFLVLQATGILVESPWDGITDFSVELKLGGEGISRLIVGCLILLLDASAWTACKGAVQTTLKAHVGSNKE